MRKNDMNYWTRKDFEALPVRAWNADHGLFSSLIIMPLRGTHESGYRLLDVVGTEGSAPTLRLSGCSDVLHFNGISGHGESIENIRRDYKAGFPYAMDCLKVSGFLRLFANGFLFKVDPALSSFSFYPVPK